MPFQAGLVSFEAHFKQDVEDERAERLKMEHIYFPLGLWLAGLLISAIFLLAEITIHRRRKSQTEVAMLKLEEPSVTLSTPESENLGEMEPNKWKAVDLDVSENIEDTKV